MKQFLIVFLFIISFSNRASSQSDGCDLTISLLTCTPGAELYSSFGHSAFRVQNTATGEDLIFNYGTFDFNDPDFYAKFVRGKLLYFVSLEQYNYFMFQYSYEGRGVTEQILNLDCEMKQELFSALKENIKEENKYYHYDFLYDNCSTRLWDMLKNHTDADLKLGNILPEKDIRFRNLLHEYLDKGGMFWSKLGIDILLGLPVDKKVKNEQALFLPDYLMEAIDSTNINGTPLVASKSRLLPMLYQPEINKFTSPLVVFTIFWLIIAFLSLNRRISRSVLMKIIDFVYYFLTGAAGILLIFMWFGTDHAVCAYNFNLLWALPINIIVAFFVFNQNKYIKIFRLLWIWYLILLIIWIFLPQQMNLALVPIVATGFIRSFARSGQIK